MTLWKDTMRNFSALSRENLNMTTEYKNNNYTAPDSI